MTEVVHARLRSSLFVQPNPPTNLHFRIHNHLVIHSLTTNKQPITSTSTMSSYWRAAGLTYVLSLNRREEEWNWIGFVDVLCKFLLFGFIQMLMDWMNGIEYLLMNGWIWIRIFVMEWDEYELHTTIMS